MQNVRKLLDHLSPHAYRVALDITKDNQSFSGSSSLEATTAAETNLLTLHAKDLEVTQSSISYDDQALKVAKTTYDDTAQTVSFELNEKLPAQAKVTLELEFNGTISKSMHGIYPADYTENDTAKTIISTQFESHHAREVFPCVDEPAAKATFALTLTANDQEFISNTPVKEESVQDGRKTVTFEETPVMSTYLLAFALGDFGSVETTTKRGTLVRAFAPQTHTSHLGFALETSRLCLEFFEDYFQIDYPLEKCDFIAIPEFAAGAMENWGCITFRETALLVDEQNTSLINKQRVALVIAHELAHQWFGNLVTMQWWNDLWLNEGFASWIEYLAVDSIYPEWNMWSNFVADEYSGALHIDALDSTHPIVMPVHDPREINEIFDAISYNKGPAILRMLHDYIGPETFRKGLSQYLTKHAYGNATTTDLWESLSAAAGTDVAAFMDSWTRKPGYPYLQVTDANNTWKITQQRFLLHPEKKADGTLWQVPLLPNADRDDQLDLLTKKTLTIDNVEGSLVKLNTNQSGLYRVAYEPEHYLRLAKLVAQGSLSTEDRMGIVDDVFELAKAGMIDTTACLTLLEGYLHEDSYPVWSTLGGELAHLRHVLLTPDNEQLLAPLVHTLIKERYEALGWEAADDESDNDTLTRPIIISLALRYEFQDAPHVATQKLHEMLKNQTPLPADLRSAVYAHAARHGDDNLYETFFELYLSTDLQEEKQRFARALTTFRKPELIKRSLKLVNSPQVRQQDAISWLAGLFGNEFARDEAWHWYQDNWVWIQDTFGDGHIYSYFAQILGAFTDEAKVDEIKTFFADKDTNGLQMSLDQAIEKIEYQSLWRQRDQEKVVDFLG